MNYCPAPNQPRRLLLNYSCLSQDMACELPDYPSPATGAIQELTSRSVITMVTLNEISVCPVNPVIAKETISEPSASSVSVNEFDVEPSVCPVSINKPENK